MYCVYTFKNIRDCQRGNASKALDHCNIAIVSRDLSRLKTSRAIMLCGKELVNTFVGKEIGMLLSVVYVDLTSFHGQLKIS